MSIFVKHSFKGGVHPPSCKELTRNAPIKRLEPPQEVVVPLIQHVGTPCLPTVKVGDNVKRGAVIGKSDKFISCPVHSPISGEIKTIAKMPHPLMGICEAIVIESDKKDEAEKPFLEYEDSARDLGSDEIRDIVKKAGIAGLGGAGFPTHVKLTPPKEKPIDTFILNGAECEPYLTCDERVMVERPGEILLGTLLMMKTVGVNRSYIAVEDNKPEAIKALSVALKKMQPLECPCEKKGNEIFDPQLELRVLPTKYPQGSEKQIIKTILNREVPAGGLPFDVGCIVDNIQTAFAVYEAVYNKKPLYERVITVAGSIVKESSNLLVRIGTPLSYIIEKCGGLKDKPYKVIMGGPMMGIAQYTMDAPVIKGTSGVLVLSRGETDETVEGVCIRCGKCVEICPMMLMPTTIMHFVKREMFQDANNYGVANCFECGACAYECPAKIPLLDYMKFAKSKIQN